MTKRLSKKVAIITGSGAGIGKALTKKHAREGTKVTIADYNEKAMNETVDELKADGYEAIGIKTNVAIQEDIEK